MIAKLHNRLRFMSTGVHPKRQTRPMRHSEALEFFIEGSDVLDREENRDLIRLGMEHDQLRVYLPLNY